MTKNFPVGDHFTNFINYVSILLKEIDIGHDLKGFKISQICKLQFLGGREVLRITNFNGPISHTHIQQKPLAISRVNILIYISDHPSV